LLVAYIVKSYGLFFFFSKFVRDFKFILFLKILMYFFFKETYCTDSTYSAYKDKLQNCSLINLITYLHYGTSGD